MPFIGKQPEVGAYQLIDSITTSATATYALTVDGSAYFPASARNLIVSLNGVTQAPESAYTVSGSNIVFASALTTSDVIDYILVIGDAVDIGTPSDGTVGTSQMSYPLGNFSSTGIDDNATRTAFTIDSNSNVGIGQSAPDNSSLYSTLHIGDGVATLEDTSVHARLILQGSTNKFGIFAFTDYFGLYDYTNSAERLRVHNSGSVSINTTASNNQLNITGSAQVLGAADTSRVEILTGAYDFYTTPSYAGVLTQYDGTARTGTTYGIPNANLGAIRFQNVANGLIGTNGSAPLIFATTSVERMRVTAVGNLNIGSTTNPLTANAAGKINVLADHGGDCFNMKSTTSGNNMVNLWSTGTTSNVAINFYKGNTQVSVGYISTSTTATSYVTSSDYRLKENVVSLENATDRLKQIPVHQFNFIADPDTPVDGFLAHEVADIVPQAVVGTKDEVDEEGNPLYQGIDHSKLVPLLVATVQELEARIAALEAN